MKRIRVVTSLGYVGANREDILEFEDEEFADMTKEDLYQLADEHGREYLETWYEVVE